jgi:hypothetical protein
MRFARSASRILHLVSRTPMFKARPFGTPLRRRTWQIEGQLAWSASPAI